MCLNEQDPPLSDGVKVPLPPSPHRTLIHLRRSAFPLHCGMIAESDGLI